MNVIKRHFLGLPLLLLLAACASHGPRCAGGRLTPINRQWMSTDLHPDRRLTAAPSAKANRS
ncbi:MAG TPA: hypothetical protein VN691_02810 [Steroidobacteraceae bacterium]|nr:hypothetical protein [Steroidobacteraceae bacterium]